MDITSLQLMVLMIFHYGQKVSSTTGQPTLEMIANGAEPANLTRTLENMFSGYNNAQRPFYRVKPAQISIALYIVSINHISEENMDFQAELYLTQRWKDPRLAFGLVNETIILQREKVQKLWLPDTVVTNAKKVTKLSDTQTVLISGSGEVVFSYRMQGTMLAYMNLHNYPMDHQELKVNFESYIHTFHKMQLQWTMAAMDVQQIATFSISSYTTKVENVTYPDFGTVTHLSLIIKVTRRFEYYVIHIYAPCVICAIISWCPFWMDRYSIGDRLTLEITILLTVMFLFQYINSSMPKVSYITAADVYILVSLIFVFLAIMENILVYLYRDDVRKKKGKGASKEQVFIKRSGRAIVPDAHPTHENKAYCSGEEAHDTQSIPHAQPDKHKELKAIDISMKTDKISRVAFPLFYLLFVVVYFSWALSSE